MAPVAGIAQFFEGVDKRCCSGVFQRHIINHGKAATWAQAAHTLTYKLRGRCKVMRSQPAGDSVKAGARKRKLLGVVQREYCGLGTLSAQKLARSQQHRKCAIRGKQLGAGAAEC